MRNLEIIVASTGHGKTTYLDKLVKEDAETLFVYCKLNPKKKKV